MSHKKIPGHIPDVLRFIGGRRRHNARKKLLAARRRKRIVDLAVEKGWNLFDHGFRTRMAEELGVHQRTIAKDVKIIIGETLENLRCPVCGRPADHENMDNLYRRNKKKESHA